MENLFNVIAKAINPETAAMQSDLIIIESKINQIEKQQQGGYTSQVAKSFHLGMVGGSGKNNYRLNKRRESELNKTIDLAVQVADLYKKRDDLKAKINYIESGQRERDQTKKQSRNELLAEMWKRLKAGDVLPIGNSNGNPTIAKKNLKSCTTTTGSTWKAAEVIGSEAAKLL